LDDLIKSFSLGSVLGHRPSFLFWQCAFDGLLAARWAC
jgi:hypothetical protein